MSSLAIRRLRRGSAATSVAWVLVERGLVVVMPASFCGERCSAGPLGIFVGPVVLAVADTLLMAWIADSEPAA